MTASPLTGGLPNFIETKRSWFPFRGQGLSVILLLFGFLLPLPFANACGVSYLGEDYRVAFLNPYVIGGEYSAFFYSSNWLNSYENDQKGSDRQRNCTDWAKYAGAGVSTNEVQAVVYAATYDELLNAIAEGADNQRFVGNSFFQFLIKKEKKAVLDYLLLAKEYEHFSALEVTDPWADRWSDDSEKTMTLAEKGKQAVRAKMEKRFKAEKDPFLRRRYAYQLLVMSRYAADAERFEQLYAEHFRGSDALADWATFHRAAIVEDTIEANYLLAQSFGRCPEKRIYCYQHFNKNTVDATLKLCKTDAERAWVIGLAALRNPGRALPQIEKIRSLDAMNPLLPLLLVREVNKLEDWLLTDELTGMGTANYPEDDTEEKWEWNEEQWKKFREDNKKRDRLYLGKIRDFAAGFASQKGGVAASSDLLNLLAGHLYLIDKQGVAAEKYLAAISPKADKRIAEQQITEQILLLLNGKKLDDAAVKEQLAGLLNRLKPMQQNSLTGKRDFAALQLLLSKEYQQRGDLLTAYFFHNHSFDIPSAASEGTAYYQLIGYLDWQATEQDIDAILALMDKKGKTAFERYLTSAPLPSRNALLDLRGTISFRKNDLSAAVAAFGKVDKGFWEKKYEFNYYLDSDPFILATDSLHRGEFPATKTAFVQRMIDLENEAKANPAKAAENYWLLGTAWFNCSYFGKSWMMYSYGQSVGEVAVEDWYQTSYYFQPESEVDKKLYYQCQRAFEYLDKAKAATNDREMLAKVEYLKARHRSWSYELTPDEQAKLDEIEWDNRQAFFTKKEMSYFKDWASAYKSTSYYDEITATCPILVTYFGK